MLENMKKLRLSIPMEQEPFAAQFGVKKTTYSNYEATNVEPRFSFIKDVADKYHVTLDYLLDFADDPHGTRWGRKSDLERRYEALDETSRKVVDAIMEIESGRGGVPITKKERTKIIPLFPAAAGPGEPVDDNAFDDYEVPEDSQAQFAVRISGDSMEPELRDGEIVLCRRKIPEVGEIGVLMVNGFLLVKQYITDGANIYLRSINRARKDLDVDLWATGDDTVVGYGTVIHRKIPLVIQ